MVSKIWNLLSPQDQHAQGIKPPMDTFLLVVDLGIFPILSKLVLWLTFTKIAGVSVVDNIYHKTPQCQHSSLCPSCGVCANIQKR